MINRSRSYCTEKHFLSHSLLSLIRFSLFYYRFCHSVSILIPGSLLVIRTDLLLVAGRLESYDKHTSDCGASCNRDILANSLPGELYHRCRSTTFLTGKYPLLDPEGTYRYDDTAPQAG